MGANQNVEPVGDNRPNSGGWNVNFPMGYFTEAYRPASGAVNRPQTAGPLGRSTPIFTGTDFNPDNSYDEKAHSRPATGKLPDYVTMDKQVARFYAHFFQERNWDREGPLGEPELEKEICRLVTIQYYLYDNEVQILEPKVTNAGNYLRA